MSASHERRIALSRRPRIGVVGGGISGLAVAYYLHEEGAAAGLEQDVTLLEQSPRLGGVIETVRQEGLLLEAGPDAFAPGSQVLSLIDALQLSDQLLALQPGGRGTFIYNGRTLQPLPRGMAFVAPVSLRDFWTTAPLSVQGKLRALAEPLIPRSRGDISLRRFLRRRLGRELSRKIAEPLVSALHGGSIDGLSAVSSLPQLHGLEQRYGSLWWGMRKTRPSGGPPASPLMTLAPGLSCLVEKLADRLGPETISAGNAQTGVQERAGWVLTGERGSREFDALVFCTPSYTTARFLENINPEAARLLRQVPYRSGVSVYLAYRRSEVAHELRGTGFVTDGAAGLSISSCGWVSSKFEGRSPPETILLRCSLRADRSPLEDDELALLLHREIEAPLGISGDPVFARCFRYHRALPRLLVGHRQRMAQLSNQGLEDRGLFITSSFSQGSGIPECVRGAARTAHRVMALLRSPGWKSG